MDRSPSFTAEVEPRTRPGTAVPELRVVGCEQGTCPAERVFQELFGEVQRRERGDEAAALNIDRLADSYAKQAVAVGKLEGGYDGLLQRFAHVETRFDAIGVRFDALDARVASLSNVKWWIVGIVGAFEVLKESGLSGVVKAIVAASGG